MLPRKRRPRAKTPSSPTCGKSDHATQQGSLTDRAIAARQPGVRAPTRAIKGPSPSEPSPVAQSTDLAAITSPPLAPRAQLVRPPPRMARAIAPEPPNIAPSRRDLHACLGVDPPTFAEVNRRQLLARDLRLDTPIYKWAVSESRRASVRCLFQTPWNPPLLRTNTIAPSRAIRGLESSWSIAK